MNVRKIREYLGRVKTTIQRRDYQKALELFCAALRELGNQAPPLDIRGDIRTAVADLCADPLFRKEFSQPVSYQPGKERELLAFFGKFYNSLSGHETEENHETVLARKMNLDRCINNGRAYLTQGKPSEADQCFAEAFKYYKNEFAAFSIMARAMMEAKEYVRALGYLRKGLNEKRDDAALRQLAEECLKKRAEAGR